MGSKKKAGVQRRGKQLSRIESRRVCAQGVRQRLRFEFNVQEDLVPCLPFITLLIMLPTKPVQEPVPEFRLDYLLPSLQDGCLPSG